MTVSVSGGLHADVDRGPNWLFVKLHPKKDLEGDVPQLADELWSIVSRHFTYRLVLELDELKSLPNGLMGQLVMLQERLANCGGALRLCGLSPKCERKLRRWQMDRALPNHTNREVAVMGTDLSKPR